MKRKVYLEGELGHKFGTEWELEAESVRDVFKCIDANNSGVREYLLDCHEKDVGFTIDVAGNEFELPEEMLMNLKEGDVTITPIPAGSKSGGAKILAAFAIAALVIVNPGGFFAVKAGSEAALAGAAVGSFTTPGLIAASIAINLALTGIMQVMAPDPATDSAQPESYLFNGVEQNIIEGDPVPVLYGRLRVPGQPINFDISGLVPSNSTRMIDRDGNVIHSARQLLKPTPKTIDDID